MTSYLIKKSNKEHKKIFNFSRFSFLVFLVFLVSPFWLFCLFAVFVKDKTTTEGGSHKPADTVLPKSTIVLPPPYRMLQ